MKFNQKYYNYSLKNIPIPSEKLYEITLFEKVELLVKGMRWKVHLFENNNIQQSNLLHYIFKSRKIHHNIKTLSHLKMI